MIPYSVIEYYGPVSNFDYTGKGLSTYSLRDIYAKVTTVVKIKEVEVGVLL